MLGHVYLRISFMSAQSPEWENAVSLEQLTTLPRLSSGYELTYRFRTELIERYDVRVSLILRRSCEKDSSLF